MALTVSTSSPQALLKAIKEAIDDKKIDTWIYDSDGDFTHAPDQWRNKAWFCPKIVAGALQFGLLGQKKTIMTKVVYSVYHGRFAEMLLTHFDDRFHSPLSAHSLAVRRAACTSICVGFAPSPAARRISGGLITFAFCQSVRQSLAAAYRFAARRRPI